MIARTRCRPTDLRRRNFAVRRTTAVTSVAPLIPFGASEMPSDIRKMFAGNRDLSSDKYRHVHRTSPHVHPTSPHVHRTRPRVHRTSPHVHRTRPRVDPTNAACRPTNAACRLTFVICQTTFAKVALICPLLMRFERFMRPAPYSGSAPQYCAVSSCRVRKIWIKSSPQVVCGGSSHETLYSSG